MVNIVGKTECEAESVLRKHGKQLRVVQRDDTSFVGSCEYWPDRINVVVESGKISKIISAG